MVRLNVGNQNNDQGKSTRKAVSLSQLSFVPFIASVLLSVRGSLLLLSAPAWSSAQPVLPLNPWFNYYGFPWNMYLFCAFFALCIYSHIWKLVYLPAFRYSVCELVSARSSTPLTPLYL